jgi:hypothetical protein
MTYEPDFVERDRRKLARLYDTPSAELSDLDYLTLCIVHGVSWPGAGMRPYAFMRPRWLDGPCRLKQPCEQAGWIALAERAKVTG